MSFPVHRSDEADPRERGEAFGRAQAAAVRHTVTVYERMFKALGVSPGEITVPEAARKELAGIAAGAGVSEQQLLAVNARTEVLAGQGPSECSVIGAGGLLAQNWDWHPDLAASTVIWIVSDGPRWFATLTEAGILAKIGLNDAGLGVCLNLLRCSTDGGHEGTPIHVLLRETLQTRSVDEAVALLTGAQVSASSAVTVATPGDVATVELSPGGANVLRGAIGAHTNHFLAPPPDGEDVIDSVTTGPRLEAIRRLPLLEALRSHESRVCRHLDPAEPWPEQTVTIASIVMNLAARRLHVAAGHPCTHPHELILTPPPASDPPTSTALL